MPRCVFELTEFQCNSLQIALSSGDLDFLACGNTTSEANLFKQSGHLLINI